MRSRTTHRMALPHLLLTALWLVALGCVDVPATDANPAAPPTPSTRTGKPTIPMHLGIAPASAAPGQTVVLTATVTALVDADDVVVEWKASGLSIVSGADPLSASAMVAGDALEALIAIRGDAPADAHLHAIVSATFDGQRMGAALSAPIAIGSPALAPSQAADPPAEPSAPDRVIEMEGELR